MAAFARTRFVAAWKLYTADRQKKVSKVKTKYLSAENRSVGLVLGSVIGTGDSDFELDLGPRGLLRVPAGFDAAELRRLL
jgi:hypothetical protein